MLNIPYETYYDRYNELKEKYKVKFINSHDYLHKPDCSDCDVAIQWIGNGYAHAKYRILKNEPNLSTKDLAILCDSGNLCFGYRVEGGLICIHTD